MTRRRILALAPVAAALLAGCGANSHLLDSALVVPGYYDTLECSELVQWVSVFKTNVKDLSALVAKSSADTSGVVADVLAYNTDLAKAEAKLRAAEEASKRKNCPQPATPAAAPPPSAKPPRRAGLAH